MKKVISIVLCLMMVLGGEAVFAKKAAVSTTPTQSAEKTVVKAPFIKDKNGKTVLILKFDDFGAGNFASFKEIAEYLIENDVHAGFGAIGKNCTDLTKKQLEEIKGWTEKGIEIWCHGYNHSINRNTNPYTSDYQSVGADAMKENVSGVLDIFKKSGIEIKSVGAPYNLNDDVFLEMLNKNKLGITSLLYGDDASGLFNGYILGNRINYEPSTGVPSFDTFKKNYEAASEKPFGVSQGHPGNWKTSGYWDELVKTVEYIKSNNVTTMTPSEYVAYIEAAASGEAAQEEEKTEENTEIAVEANPAEAGENADENAEENASENTDTPKIVTVINDSALGHLRVVLSDGEIDFSKYDNVYPIIENDRTLIPIRAISVSLGASVLWEEETKKITVSLDGRDIVMHIDSYEAAIGDKTTSLDCPPKIINSRTMVPLRFVCEAFNLTVDYKAE